MFDPFHVFFIIHCYMNGQYKHFWFSLILISYSVIMCNVVMLYGCYNVWYNAFTVSFYLQWYTHITVLTGGSRSSYLKYCKFLQAVLFCCDGYSVTLFCCYSLLAAIDFECFFKPLGFFKLIYAFDVIGLTDSLGSW